MADSDTRKPFQPKKLNYPKGAERVIFADTVSVRSTEDGFYMVLGTINIEDPDSINVQAQVFLPPKVAGAAAAILMNHVANFQAKTKTQILPGNIRIEGLK